MLDEPNPGMNYTALGHDFNVSESTLTIKLGYMQIS